MEISQEVLRAHSPLLSACLRTTNETWASASVTDRNESKSGLASLFFLQDLAKVLNVLIFLWIVLVNSLISGNYLSVPGILDEILPNVFDWRGFFYKSM